MGGTRDARCGAGEVRRLCGACAACGASGCGGAAAAPVYGAQRIAQLCEEELRVDERHRAEAAQLRVEVAACRVLEDQVHVLPPPEGRDEARDARVVQQPEDGDLPARGCLVAQLDHQLRADHLGSVLGPRGRRHPPLYVLAVAHLRGGVTSCGLRLLCMPVCRPRNSCVCVCVVCACVRVRGPSRRSPSPSRPRRPGPGR